MGMDLQQQKGQDTALSSLNKAIDALNLKRDAVSALFIRAAFDSAGVLLTTIKESVIDEAEYVELGLAYAKACETLGRGANRRQTNQLSQPVRKAVEQLATTAIEIHKTIIKQGKRSVISRIFHPKKEKVMFDAWWLGLKKILNVFNTEFESNAPATTPNIPRGIANTQTTVNPGGANAATTIDHIPPNVSNPGIVSESPVDAVNKNTSTRNAPSDESMGDTSREIHGQSEVSNAINSLGDLSATKQAEVGAKPSRVNDKDAHAVGSIWISANPASSTKDEMAIPMRLGTSAAVDNAGGLPLSEDPFVRGGSSNGNNNGSMGIDEVGDRVAEFRGLVDHLTAIRTAMGGNLPIPGGEEVYKSMKDTLTFLEHITDSTTDFDPFQLKKVTEEFLMFMDHDSDLPAEVLLRQDNRPVVIRTPDPKCAHVGQLWQALYHVPQVRSRIFQYQGTPLPEGATEADTPPSETEGQVLSVRELFEYMESSGLGVVTGEPSMGNFPNRPWEGISPREDVENAYKDFSERVEVCLDGVATQRPDFPRLFHSHISGAMSHKRTVFDAKEDFSFISVEYNDEDDSSNLVGCLTNQVFPKILKQRSPDADRATTSKDCATIEAADVIAFSLARDEAPPPRGDATARISQVRRKFSFPESFHLDRFAAINTGLNSDADPAENFPPGIVTEGSAAKARESITAEIKTTASPTTQPRSELSNFSPEVSQPGKYDLRAVLMHGGRKGRTRVYSYVSHDNAWWKIVDYTVTKVMLEEVLNDEAGMYLGAGPFFLIYSRSLAVPPLGE